MSEANGKGGAPNLNRNRTTHGVRGWLAIGSYPKRASYVRRIVGRMRAELEAEVLDVHGRLGKYQAAIIQSAARHEGVCLLWTRWLKDEAPNMSVSERLAVTARIEAATDARDRCLEKLGISELPDERDPWATIDEPREDPQHAPESPGGQNGKSSHPPQQNAPADPHGGDAGNSGPASPSAWQPHHDGQHETSTAGNSAGGQP